MTPSAVLPLQLTNPCDFPIEVVCLELDEQLAQDEALLKACTRWGAGVSAAGRLAA